MIYLTSSLNEVADHLHQHHLQTIEPKTVLFVQTAAEESIEEGTSEWLERDHDGWERNGYQTTRYTIVGKTAEEIASAINDHSIIYFSGGNTIHVLKHLHESGGLQVIKDAVAAGKTYVGTSAGSIMACPELPNYLRDEGEPLETYESLELVNFILGGHWGTESFFKDAYLNKRIPASYKRDQYPLVLLTDYQYIVTDGTTFKLIDTNRT